MEPPLSEDEMAEVKKEALEKLRPYLCDKVIAERHFDYLRAKKILSKEDTEEISHQVASRRRAGKLLDHLMENPKGLDTLVCSIRREGTQNFLVQKITDEVQRIKNDKLFQKGVFSGSVDSSDEASTTNNLSRFCSTESNASKGKEANILFHPEGEFSPLPSACPSYCPLPSAPSPSYCLLTPSPSLVKLSVATLPTTTSLPRPGDPGAPPLPPDLKPPPTGPPDGTTDSEFLPLRSRSP